MLNLVHFPHHSSHHGALGWYASNSTLDEVVEGYVTVAFVMGASLSHTVHFLFNVLAHTGATQGTLVCAAVQKVSLDTPGDV
jgi:hypothetical protein